MNMCLTLKAAIICFYWHCISHARQTVCTQSWALWPPGGVTASRTESQASVLNIVDSLYHFMAAFNEVSCNDDLQKGCHWVYVGREVQKGFCAPL